MIPGWPIEEGAAERGWVSLAALAGARFDFAQAYFDAAAAFEPGLDRRGQGAYFLGSLAYYYGFALAWPVLHDRGTPDLSGEHLVMKLGAPNLDLRYRVVPGAGPATAPMGAMIEAVFTPLIARIKDATRLGEPAQWRLVADGIAGSFIAVGAHLDCLARAQEIGLGLVRDPTYRFFNGHTGYYDIDGQCFLKRGGCCRFYTAERGSYCATCILRPPHEHVDEIRRRYGLAAAS